MNKIVVGMLGLELNGNGICGYGKKEPRALFRWPIQLGTYIIQEINDEEDVRLEIVKEGKKYYFIAYDDRKLGMIAKGELPRVYIEYMIIEIVCRKFKVNSRLSKIETITKNGIETRERVWLDNPDTVEENQLREFLCGRRRF